MNIGILPLIGLLVALPGIPGLKLPGLKDLKKLRQSKAVLLDSLPPAWKPSSRLALENQFVRAGMPVLGPPQVRLRMSQDPRKLRIGLDSDSSQVRYVTEFNDIAVGVPGRFDLGAYARETSRRTFERVWQDRARDHLRSASPVAAGAATGGGMRFELPSPLPGRFKNLLGPGGPSLTVSGSENIKLSGNSTWSNQQTGPLGQKRSLFPSLDMQQDLDIRLEGRLSDRVGVNLLQNSANQVPLANRIAINYKGDEDDLVQALDLGNTNLSLPGTQYVSYSGKNEGLFGMKATTRLGPLDFTVLASKQEGRSERAGYSAGASEQTHSLGDKDYVRGVYFMFYDPSLGVVQDIDDGSVTLYLDEGTYQTQLNTIRGRAFVDPATACTDTLACLDGPDADALPDTTRSVRGTFRQLKPGADQDYEILSNVYGPLFKVIRLRQALTGEKQRLAVTYRYREVVNGVVNPDSVRVGGLGATDYDGEEAMTMKLIRAPLDELPIDAAETYITNPEVSPFIATRELELRNFYQLQGTKIVPKSFRMAIRKGDDFPPVTTVRAGLPYIEVLGLDNFDESSTFTGYDNKGHDGIVDGTGPVRDFTAFVDFDRGTLFLPDPRPFAPRLANDTTGRSFDRYISTLLFRRDSLTGSSDATEPNPRIYTQRINRPEDRIYTFDFAFTAGRAGNEISLGRSNIIEGSEVVTIDNQPPLQRGKDYRIDYDLGRVTMIRQVGPDQRLNIDYSYAPIFQQAGRTLIGNAFRWEGRDRGFGGAFLYESKGAQDQRPRLGEEPSQVLIGDLNTEWHFKPAWVTRIVDRLPGVRTSQPSELNVQAEVGMSFPNPNTRNEIFIDDMEGVRDAVSLSMSPDRWRWSSVPLRNASQKVDDPGLPEPQKNTELHWYSPLNAVRERELKPSLSDAQGAQNSRQVLALSLPRRPTAAAPADRLWAGLTYPLDLVGIDLSRAQFIEVWVNDFRDFHAGTEVPRVRGNGVRLHIDLGAVPEDQQRAPNVPPNGVLDSEDLPPRDNQLTVVDENNEDTGFDNLLDAQENPIVVPDLTTVSGVDPQGDNFALPNSDYKDWDPRKWRSTNGTEDNKNIEPVPDTEDLNLNNSLDPQGSYFEYTIDLGDTASRYLVTDVFNAYSVYANDNRPLGADNGWRRYRIPLADSLRTVFGTPDLTLARHVRVWIENVLDTDPPELNAEDGRPFLALGGLDIVGSRWVAGPLDSVSRQAGTTLTLNSVNTIDNADIYVPPFDPGRTRSGSQEVSRREQTLALEFTQFEPRDTLEAFKTFSLDENYSRYGKLDWFAAGYAIPTYDEATDTLDYFVRFASDERGTNYYEYRRRVPRSSAPGQIGWEEVEIALTDLSNLKLNPDFPKSGDVLYRAPGRTPLEQYVIRGRPSFTRLRRMSVGIINLSAKTFPTGQVWFNELRATDVARDAGQAQRVSVNGRLANLLHYNMGWNGTGADFQSVGQTRGAGNSDNSFSLNGGFDAHRFFEGTKILLPMTFGYQNSRVSPRFTAGDDVVRTGVLAEASDTRRTSRSASISYSRTWGERSNPFLRYTLGGITANMNGSQSENRDPNSVDTTRTLAAQVNYSVAPRQLFSLGVPGTRLRIHPLPERFYWNYQVQTNRARRYDRERDSLGTLVLRNNTYGRNADIAYGMDTRPLDFFRHSFQARRNLQLPEKLLERVGFINFGRTVSWSQDMDARFNPQKLGPWIRPTLSWRAGYTQNTDPNLSEDLSVRAIGNRQSITLDWDFPFDRLLGGTRAVAAGDTLKRRGPAGWRRLLARLGPLQTDASFASSSDHNRLLGTPNLMYLFGVTRDPGFAVDSTGVQRLFGNVSRSNVNWKVGGFTNLDLGLGTSVITRGDITTTNSDQNGVETRSSQISFPSLEVTYGRLAEVVRLDRILTTPRLKTRFNRSQRVDYSNSQTPTSIATSSEWRPLIEIAGDLRNGTKTSLGIERRVTKTENRLLGNSVATERNMNVNFQVSRSYSKGQKVSFLGKETTVKSNVNLGLAAAYERRSSEVIDSRYTVAQLPLSTDRLSVNANGGYFFSNNVTGTLELGFGQSRDLVKAIVTRNVRVELRAQFTF